MESVFVPLVASLAAAPTQGELSVSTGEEAGTSPAAEKSHGDGANGHEVSPVVALTAKCYQCGKCTAGCPVADRMDLVPNVVFRLVQLGQLDRAMRCGAIWQCVSCFTCATRCPQSVDCVAVMDALRAMAVKANVVPAEQRSIVLFQQAFLNNIRKYGRLNEVQLIGNFKTCTFLETHSLLKLFDGAMLGPKMMGRAKLHLKGESVKDRTVVNRIFERCLAQADVPKPTEGHTA